jgi:hypothetical protein
MVLLLLVEWVIGGGKCDESFVGLAHGLFVEWIVGVDDAVTPPAPQQGIDGKGCAIREYAVKHHE